MATLYVAQSKGLANWGASVGLTKHLYKVGVTDGAADAAIKALNETAAAGQRDWKLVKKQPLEDLDEAAALELLAQKEKLVDPALYPGIKGAAGIYKVKLVNVENSVMVAKAMAGLETRAVTIKPADIAVYLMNNISPPPPPAD